MTNYEVTFIVDPVLSGDEITATAATYEDLIKNEGASIVAVDRIGLKQLAYPINKRSSGVYYCTEFQTTDGGMISKMELAFRRDERIMRFLTIKLDKYGVKYNEDKRNGLIGTVKKKKDKEEAKKDDRKKSGARKEAPKKEAPKAAPAPVAAATEAPAAKDDLTKIEGIGPKIAEVLTAGGVATYADLSSKSAEDVKAMLEAAEGNFASHDPSTWSNQAKLAADGKWEELKTLQDELDGGKVVAKSEEE